MESDQLASSSLQDSTSSLSWEVEEINTEISGAPNISQSPPSDLSSTSSKRTRSTLRDPDFLNLITSSEASEAVKDLEDTQYSVASISTNSTIQHTHLDEFPKILPHFSAPCALLNLNCPRDLIRLLNQNENMVGIIRNFQLNALMPDTTSLRSCFLPSSSNRSALPPPGRNSADYKVIEMGYNVHVFFRSLRLLREEPPRVMRYKLRGNYRQAKDFMDELNAENRQKDAYRKWANILLEDDYRKDTITPGFEGLAAAFFGGKEVFDLEYYELQSNRQKLLEQPSSSGDTLLHEATPEAANYDTVVQSETPFSNNTITKLDGDWTKVLEMTNHEQLLKDGPFSIFLTDLVMNCDLETAARRHSIYYGLRVYSQTTEIQNIEKNFDMIEKLDSVENLGVKLRTRQYRKAILSTEREDMSDSTVREDISNNNNRDSILRGEVKRKSFNKQDLASPVAKVGDNEILKVTEVGLADGLDWFHEERTAFKKLNDEKKSKKNLKKSKLDHRKQLNTDVPAKLEEDDSTTGKAEFAFKGADIFSGTSGVVSAESRASITTRNSSASPNSAGECDVGEWNVVQPKSNRKASHVMLLTKQPFPNKAALMAKPFYGPRTAAQGNIPRLHPPHRHGFPGQSSSASKAHQTRNKPKHTGPMKSVQNHGKDDIGKLVQEPSSKPTGERIYDPSDYPAIPTPALGSSDNTDSMHSSTCVTKPTPLPSITDVSSIDQSMDDDVEQPMLMDGSKAVELNHLDEFQGTSEVQSESVIILVSTDFSNIAANDLLSTKDLSSAANSCSKNNETQLNDNASELASLEKHELNSEDHNLVLAGNDSSSCDVEVDIPSTIKDSCLHSKGAEISELEFSAFAEPMELRNAKIPENTAGQFPCMSLKDGDNLSYGCKVESNSIKEDFYCHLSDDKYTKDTVSDGSPEKYDGQTKIDTSSSSPETPNSIQKSAGYSGSHASSSPTPNTGNVASLGLQHNEIPTFDSEDMQQAPQTLSVNHKRQENAQEMSSGSQTNQPQGPVNTEPANLAQIDRIQFGSYLPAADDANESPTPIHPLSSGSHDRPVNLQLFAGKCTYCHDAIYPTIEAPIFMCPGCGPMCNVRYCSVACLLVDVFNHCNSCMQYPASQRLVQPDLPMDVVYERDLMVALNGCPDSPFRLRQKSFSIYCHSGQFPKLYKAWAKRAVEVQVESGFDANESIKKTGDYAVFRSDLTGGSVRGNPHSDVIFTIKLDKHNPMRQALARTLNACFLLLDKRIVEFLYRLILHLILDEEYFEMLKYMEPAIVVHDEFRAQFKLEFEFDATADGQLYGPFDFNREWYSIDFILRQLEQTYPVLLRWVRN